MSTFSWLATIIIIIIIAFGENDEIIYVGRTICNFTGFGDEIL